MLIRHLALTVRDPPQSRDFYLRTVGLDGRATEEAWGVRVNMPDGFMLALIRGEPAAPGSGEAVRVHFGCTLRDREHARRLREQLREAGVRELEWEDERPYTGVKVEDPDGYVVELFYETV